MDEDKFKDKDSHKRVSKKSQEISRKSVTCMQSSKSSKIPSSSSIRSKKSSNLLSTFVRRSKRKQTKHSEPILETVTVSTHNLNYIASNSSLGIHTEEEMELKVENYEKKTCPLENTDEKQLKATEENLNTTDSNHSVLSSGKMTHRFFRKFIKKHHSLENEKRKSEHALGVQTSKSNILEVKKSCKICQSESCKDVTKKDKGFFKNISCVPTSFINFGKSTLSVTLSNGLQSVQELASRFRESENHLIQTLSRYIKDPTFQKELIETLSQHSQLQWEAERRTSALANDMWMHQIEIGRAQERTLQETLNSIVKQNRQLQIDNEVMFRKHEKLVRKLRSFPEMSTKYKCVDCETQIEHVIKHNEKLQLKLDSYVQQMENLESELQILQKHTDGMEDQLRNSSSQVHDLKDSIHKFKTDYELQLVSLNYKLQTTEQTIKEGKEAGEILIEDLDGFTRQFRNLTFAINWSKFKCRGSSLTDLIHISRSCINELSKEIMSLQTQITLKERDMEALQETNTKLQESLKKSTTELDNLSKRRDESSSLEAERIISEQKCKILETDLKSAHDEIDKLNTEHDMEKQSLLTTIANYENLNNEISEKNKMIEQTKMFITNITSENLALRKQMEGLNRLLSQSGAGDVARELATCQEQIAYFQAQYYELLNEKQHCLNEIEILRMDKKSNIQHQEDKYKNLQAQLQNIEKVNKENNLLKQQLESEHQTVLSLQTERMKYLEEKSMLKTVFQHMKSEISRVQKLENAVADISKEASKLAMVAEYNKHIGEKLKGEVQERDQTISQLRSSVEKLNDIQVQNTKEKLSLCYELSEVCQMKEKLNSILTLEVQKNMALDDSKRELFDSASTQLKKYEEMQKNGRSALKEVLRDYKSLAHQRDALLKDKETLQQELSELKITHKEQLKKYDTTVSEKNEKEVKIAGLTAKQEEDKKSIDSLKEKLKDEISKYDETMRQLEKLIRQLRKEKEDLEDTVKYLQNNIQKLHNDLNDSRKNEKESKDLLNKCMVEKEMLEKEKQQWEKNYAALNEDKDKLINEINYLNGLCEKVLCDFEASIKSSVEKEEMFKTEINESNVILFNHSREIERLNKALTLKQREIQKNADECTELKKKEKELNKLIKSFETQSLETKETENKKQDLENDLSSLQVEYESSQIQLENVKKEVQCVQKQLQVVIDQREKDYGFYKNRMDQLLRKNEELQSKSKKELGELKISLNDTAQKLNNERTAYATLSEIHKEVSAKFLKSVKDFGDEKNVRREIEAKLKETTDCLEHLQSEKADLQQQINILLDGLNEEKNHINVLIQERDSALKCSDDLQKRYNDILSKCLTLENQLRSTELNVTNETNQMKYKFQDQLDHFKKESQENHELILTLKENIGKLQHQITGLEFQKSEMTLRLHETQRKFETEQNLCEQLENTHKLILAAILKMRDDGKVEPCDIHHLLHMVRNNNDSPRDNELECN